MRFFFAKRSGFLARLLLCPIYPAVSPCLREAWDAAAEGAVSLFPSIRSPEKNLRSWLEKAIQTITVEEELQDAFTQPVLALSLREPTGNLRTYLACLQNADR